jgi:hypothetical protein
MKVKYKGKEYNIPKHYLADLKGKDRTAQIKSIVEGKKRPKTDFKSKRSGWVVKFEKKYKTKITDKDFIHKNILRKAGQEQVIKKGKGAYYSSGSRPNQTPFSWGYGRLASVILNGPARKIDKNIWDKYKV